MMNLKRRLQASALLLVAAVGFVGCAARRYNPVDPPPPRKGPVHPGPEVEPQPPPAQREYEDPQKDPIVVKPAAKPLRGRLSDAEKHRIVRMALLDLQRMVISSEERLELSNGVESSSVGKEVLATKLEELGFKVIATTSQLRFAPSEGEQDRFRQANQCNLVFLMKGEAESADTFGNFHLYHAELKGKVLNLTTHQEIASKTIRQKGRRGLNEAEAAEDALEAAATDVATYLTDEVARKWEATSLIRASLVITDLDHVAEADDVRVGLQRRAGIYYVSLERWDEESETGVYDVLCRFDVQRFLPSYVDELRIGRIKVEKVERQGRVIKADQDFRD